MEQLPATVVKAGGEAGLGEDCGSVGVDQDVTTDEDGGRENSGAWESLGGRHE